MKSSYSEENLEEWLKDILNRKGGRRFGQYSKELVFETVVVKEETVLDDIQIDED